MRVLWGILAFLVADLYFSEVAGSTTCPKNYTPCNDGSGECYYTDAKCKVSSWCSRGSINQTAVCLGPPDEGFMKCKDHRYWYPIGAACNHWTWCIDKGDEDPDMCRARSCPEGTVKCKDGIAYKENQEHCDQLQKFLIEYGSLLDYA